MTEPGFELRTLVWKVWLHSLHHLGGSFLPKKQKTSPLVGAEKWPLKCPHPTPPNLCLCHLTQQRALADVIEMKVLDMGDCPGSSGWPDLMTRVLQSRRRRQGSASERQTCEGLDSPWLASRTEGWDHERGLLEAENGLRFTAREKMRTLVLHLKGLNSVTNPSEQHMSSL